MPSKLYQKTFARDYALGLVELWYRGEASDPRQWTDQAQPHQPYLVFCRTPETVEVFMDPLGIAWIQEEIKKICKKKPDFLRHSGEEYRARVREALSLVRSEPALSLEALKEFTEKVRLAWPWFEAMWWSIELLEEEEKSGTTLDFLLQVRKETESLAPLASSAITEAIAQAYPAIKAYAHVILIEEAFSENVPAEEVLQDRARGYVYTSDRLYPVSFRQEIEKVFGITLEEREGKAEQLVGKMAYPGKASGRARKVHGPKNVAAFQVGEILVSATTNPAFMPAIAKAAALVSDEGGLVSHAAIIAREWKKPCIIGTKHAMDTLNDGDMVEVDADKGIVRIL